MNQLAIIRKHVKVIEKVYGEIRSPETRGRAREMVVDMVSRMLPGETRNEAPTVVLSSGGSQTPVDGDMGCNAKEAAPEVILTPVSDHEVEKGGEGLVVNAEPRVEMIGGWPAVSPVTLYGLAPNRRTFIGRLPDNRGVLVERGLGQNWKCGDGVKCRLIRAGSHPLYRTVML